MFNKTAIALLLALYTLPFYGSNGFVPNARRVFLGKRNGCESNMLVWFNKK